MDRYARAAIERELAGQEWCHDPQGKAWPCVRVGTLHPDLSATPASDTHCYGVELLIEQTPWDPAQGVPAEPRTFASARVERACFRALPPSGGGEAVLEDWSVDVGEFFDASIDPFLSALQRRLCDQTPNCG